MMRILLVIAFFCFSAAALSQEIKIGFTTGTHLLYKMRYKEATYLPSNGYHTYIENNQGSGVVNKTTLFNSFSFGPVISASRKRITANIEPQYFYQRTVLRFYNPYETERLIGKKAFRVPIYFTWKFFKKENSLFFLNGLIFHKESVIDIQNPGTNVYIAGEAYENQPLNLGDNHFYSILYNEKSYWSLMLGLGKTTKKGLNFALRVHSRLNTQSRGIKANILNLEFTVNYHILSTKDITNKHFLYVE